MWVGQEKVLKWGPGVAGGGLLAGAQPGWHGRCRPLPSRWQRRAPGSTGRSARRGERPGSLGRRQAGAGADPAGNAPAGRAGTRRLSLPWERGDRGHPRSSPCDGDGTGDPPAATRLPRVPAQVSSLWALPFGLGTWRCRPMPQGPRCSRTQPRNRGDPPSPASHSPSTAALLVSRQRRPSCRVFFLPSTQRHPSNPRPCIYLLAMRSQGWLPGEECTPFCLF